ncbi:MAG TPA: hypothetical protein VK829_07705 [Terriglobales bacterium]|jgi:hypothetical protein|nr:hypothetical protein [Terriglobales bacterium]
MQKQAKGTLFLCAAPQSAAAMPCGRYLHERMDQKPSVLILEEHVLHLNK